MFALASGVGVGTTSLVARCLGRKDLNSAESAAKHSLLLAATVGPCFALTGLVCQRSLFTLMGAGPDILPLVLEYSTLIFLGSIFILISIAASSVLRGEGDMRTPMVTMIIAVVLNAVLDPLLIFGIGIFPRLGVRGAAMATLISRAVGCVLIVGYLFKGRALIRLRLRGFRYDRGIIGGILSVGLPTSLNRVIMSLGAVLLIRIVAAFGFCAIAAYGIAMRLDQLVVLPCIGIATAVVAIVGHNVGARRFDRAASTA